jgi:uncharacterized membrane protein
MTAEALHNRLKLAGVLIAAGLVLEVATLYWSHPITFVAFIFGGGALVGLGVLLYLYSLVSH